MTHSVDVRLNLKLDEAQTSSACLAPSNATDRRALERRIGSSIVMPAPGIFARAAYWQGLDQLQRSCHMARALSMLHPDWVFCGPTAGALMGLPVSRQSVSQIHIVSKRHSRAKERHWLKRHELGRHKTCMVGGVTVTTMGRTIHDCMADSSFPRALAIADAALRTSGLSRDGLIDKLEKLLRKQRGIRRTLAICAHANARSDNGGESYVRGIMIEQGFEVPALQVSIPTPRNPNPKHPYRADFLWTTERGTLVIGELDGRDKYVDPSLVGSRSTLDVMREERLRESAISLYRPALVRFSFDEARQKNWFVSLLHQFDVPWLGMPELRHGVPVARGFYAEREAFDERLYLDHPSGMTIRATSFAA